MEFLLTCIYGGQVCCVVVVVLAILCVPLELQTLQNEGCPHPFSKGKAPSTGDQDSGSSLSKQGLHYIYTN